MTGQLVGVVTGWAYDLDMKRNSLRLIPGLVLGLVLNFAPSASAEVDPFPGVATGAEIPGTRLWSQPGVSQSTYEATPEYLAWIAVGCPAGSGNGVGVDMNFTESHSDDRYFNYCVKTWRPSAEIDTSTVVSNSETSTVIETSTPVVISTPAPSAPVAPITSGLGGYAIIHPDGHVCGVIVATSNDPFGNGGTMTQEYMGCPSGARIVFQTTPSESGNVAGWHGSNVTYDGSKFTVTNGSNIMTITNGIATDSNGRVWDTGTGRTITAGTVTPPTNSESATSRIESSTVVTETSTITSVLTAPVALVQETSTVIAIPAAFIDTSTVVAPTPADDLDSLPEVDAEEEISNSVLATIVGTKTRIAVLSAWANTRLNVVASKKGMKKKYTYRFTTNSDGDYTFKSSVNLKGYTVILYKGTEELDRDFV